LLDQENPSKEAPIHWAVLKNNYGIVKSLIREHRALSREEGDDFTGALDLENINQQTPFFVATIKGFLDIAELLTADGMSRIDARDLVRTS